MCDNFINALTLLASQQKYGDSPVKMVQGLQERSRLKMSSACFLFGGGRGFSLWTSAQQVSSRGTGKHW